MRKTWRALAIEGGGYCPVRLHCLEFLRGDVIWRVELRDLRIKRGERIAQLFWRGLAANADRTGVVERVIVHADTLPQPAVYESLLKLGLWIIQDVRENISRVRRLRVLTHARALPVDLDGDRAHRCFHNYAFVPLERWNRGNGISRERVWALRPPAQLFLGQGKNGSRIYVSGNDQG